MTKILEESYMKKNNKLTAYKLVLTALLAALTYISSSFFRITLPISIGGTTSFHLGNIFCALSGILLGPWLGGLSAGIGSMICDLLNPLYISEFWITFLTKGLIGLMAGLCTHWGSKKWGYGKATLGAAVGAVSYLLVYLAKSYFYNCLFLKGLTPEAALASTLARVPLSSFNAIMAIIFAPMIAVAVDKALRRANLSIDR